MISLVLGGARSGKSRYAESLVKKISERKSESIENHRVFYVATATAGDDEMAERIRQHQVDRPSSWQLIEEPLNLAEVVSNACNTDILLIDCMTLYLTNWLCKPSSEVPSDIEKLQQDWCTEKNALITALKQTPAQVVIVSNEVGSGIVPLGELSRVFVDEAGWLNQALAELANDAVLIVAGCPLILKNKVESEADLRRDVLS